MFHPERLAKLSPPHRLRKAALLLSALERGLLLARGGGAEAVELLSQGRLLAAALRRLPETPPGIRSLAEALVSVGEDGALRALDALRHGLFREGGQDRADWDLLDPETGLSPRPRRPFAGLRAYFDDIRSPFNVGSMLRSAEAFGAEEVILSQGCADPGHPRAARSAMGASGFLPWRRGGLEDLEGAGPAFALELGGTPLGAFRFPSEGIVVLGSEELGVSREALERCACGRVSIPLRGAKASINVGVAFGVLLAAWTASLASPKPGPRPLSL